MCATRRRFRDDALDHGQCRWSIGPTRTPREALAELCQIYWPPLYGYLRGHGHAPEEAQDLTQGFFARLLERRGYPDGRSGARAVSRIPAHGAQALRRSTNTSAPPRRGAEDDTFALRSISKTRNARYALEPRNEDTPERVFDRKWAAITLDRALQRLREECHRAGKGAEADTLLPVPDRQLLSCRRIGSSPASSG